MRRMPDQPPVRLVDSRRSTFVSFAPPDPVALGPRGRTPGRAPTAVGPGRAPIAEPDRDRAEPRGGVTYPIQPGKIQAPALRDETLARTRLLDWLETKIHRRVLFLIADAGYGKTTLLADFSRRTRLRTIWYRLDEDDRDWVGFLAHLVAAGREHDPGFAPRTAGILRSLEPGGPTREDAIETFLAELPSIAGDGAALIFDDFHLADEVGDIRSITKEIVARGPERLSIVFASRRAPAIPVAKLRSLGELAELGIADLRFSDSEMDQLFRETYGRPLEPDVLADLAQRTEGWAASLTLVQAALRERSPAETRSFVHGLSGARDELHDYLAEEVVGDLPEVQQQFLMRTSILQRVTPELAQVASGLDAVEVQSMITEGERLGLLGRRAKRRSAEQRYHPLVREFLEDRLRREIGPAGVNDLHVVVARWAEPTDWQAAAHHWLEAGQGPDVLRVVDANLETIVASGAFALASELYGSVEGSARSAGFEVIASRQASHEGDLELAMAHAVSAATLEPNNDVVVANLMASHVLGGNMLAAAELAESLTADAKSPLMRKVGEASKVLMRASLDGDLIDAAKTFAILAEESRQSSHAHFEGVSELNAAIALTPTGNFADAVIHAHRAIEVLSTTASGSELKSAQFAKAAATAYLGDLSAARETFSRAGVTARHAARTEYLVEHADIESQIGSAEVAKRLLDEVDENALRAMSFQWAIAQAAIAVRALNTEPALRALEAIDINVPAAYPANASRVLTQIALVKALAGHADARESARTASVTAGQQRAALWQSLALLVEGSLEGRLNEAILTTPEHLRCVITLAAELVLQHLDGLSAAAHSIVIEEARARPERWLPSIRRSLLAPLGGTRPQARLLSLVGEPADVGLLIAFGKSKTANSSDRRLARELARRLAPRVVVNDLGRVTITVGGVEKAGQEVRRKVLALLCYLLTRPRFSATREEVMEAMWPDMDPAAAINSLNQSVYFLRRVFEPEYSEDTSAGYVRQDSDLLWLDTALIESQSGQCAGLVAEHERTHSVSTVLDLSHAYRERFALDFMYEEWAADFRDWLHVSCLRVIEAQVRAFLDAGDYESGLGMARRAVRTDPRNEDLEVSLLRLLRGSGAHAAAAEQYEHYVTVLRRDLGIEPADSLEP
jgi:DNA-binding SARP family transcriptional activator